MRAMTAAMALFLASAAAAEEPTSFWNQNARTVTSLRLSHAGSGIYGDNIALGRPVPHDGRLSVANLPGGFYDAELKFNDGRTCLARHIEVAAGKTFSVEDKALIRCGKR